MAETAAPPEAPMMSIAIAAKLLKGTERDVERLVRAGKVEAWTLDSGIRAVNSGHLIFHMRAKRAEEIERRLSGREPYERDPSYVTWIDTRTGREIRADARQSYVETAPLMLDVMPPGVHAFCADCPTGPGDIPCEECPAPCSPPPTEIAKQDRRPRLFDRIFSSNRKRNRV